MADEKQKLEKKKILDEQMTISFSPRKIIKGLVLVALFVTVFFAGRFSADISGAAVVEVDEVEVQEEADEGSWFGNLLSFSGSDDESEAEEVEVVAIEEETSDTQVTGAAVADEAEQEEVEETVEEPEEEEQEPEEVVTTYENVDLQLNDVYNEWMQTWGRITHIGYTIRNSESGTIEPDYFLMSVMGYDDIEKKVPIATAGKSVKSGSSLTYEVTIPNGFAYKEGPVEVDAVAVSMRLFDASGKLIATKTKSFNLEG